MKKLSLKAVFSLVLVGIMAMMLLVFVVYHSVVTSFAKRNSSENLTFIAQQLSDRLEEYFMSLDSLSVSLATEASIVDFLSSGLEERYDYEQEVNSILNRGLSDYDWSVSILLFDSDGSFYRYPFTSVSPTDGRQLYQERISGTDGSRKTSVTLGGMEYYILAQPVYEISRFSTRRVGTVVILSDLGQVTGMLSEYDSISGLDVALWDSETLVLSYQTTIFNTSPGLLTSKTFVANNFDLIVSLDKGQVFPYESVFVAGILLVILCMVIFFLIMHQVTNRLLIKPITFLTTYMRKLGTNTLTERIPATTGSQSINLLIRDINRLLDRVEDYSSRAFHTQQRLYEMEVERQASKLSALRKQINTHFTYNTLNSIKVMVKNAGLAAVARVTAGLASLIRYAYSKEEYIHIFDEMLILGEYANIMNVRFHDKFQVHYEVDDTLEPYQILKQLLQPLVENAFIHGLENKKENCVLTITGMLRDEAVYISVRDNGVGIAPEQLQYIRIRLDSRVEDDSHEGIALLNINKRIKLYHGDAYGLSIQSEQGAGTQVTLTLPPVNGQKTLEYIPDHILG